MNDGISVNHSDTGPTWLLRSTRSRNYFKNLLGSVHGVAADVG